MGGWIVKGGRGVGEMMGGSVDASSDRVNGGGGGGGDGSGCRSGGASGRGYASWRDCTSRTLRIG